MKPLRSLLALTVFIVCTLPVQADEINLPVAPNEQITQTENHKKILQKFSNQMDETINQQLSEIEDPLTRLQVEEGLIRVKQRQMEKMSNWLQQRDKEIAEAKMRQDRDNLAMALNNAKLSPAQIHKQLDDFDNTHMPLYRNLYGPAAPVKMREAKADAVKNYLSDTAVKFPQLLKQRINLFDDVIEGTFKLYLLTPH